VRTRKVADPKPKAEDSEDDKFNDNSKDDKARRGGPLTLARAGPSDMSNYVPAKHFEEIKTKMAKEIEEL
jgi:phage I-like protein